MNETGERFELDNDNAILQINSPRESLSGPYIVVYKDLEERWALVALDWEGDPRLGIRWFWGNGGNPFSSGHGTWFVIPTVLTKGILSGLPIDHAFGGRVDEFLCGKISGDQLRSMTIG